MNVQSLPGQFGTFGEGPWIICIHTASANLKGGKWVMSHRTLTPEQFQNQCPKSIQISEFAPIILECFKTIIIYYMVSMHPSFPITAWSLSKWCPPQLDSILSLFLLRGATHHLAITPVVTWWNKGEWNPHAMTGYNGGGNNVNGGWMIHHDYSWLILFQVYFTIRFLGQYLWAIIFLCHF